MLWQQGLCPSVCSPSLYSRGPDASDPASVCALELKRNPYVNGAADALILHGRMLTRHVYACSRVSSLQLLFGLLCSPPGSSVHGILQARILEWVATSPLQGIFPTQGSNPHLLHVLHWEAYASPLCHLGSPLTGSTSSFIMVKRELMPESGYTFRTVWTKEKQSLCSVWQLLFYLSISLSQLSRKYSFSFHDRIVLQRKWIKAHLSADGKQRPSAAWAHPQGPVFYIKVLRRQHLFL